MIENKAIFGALVSLAVSQCASAGLQLETVVTGLDQPTMLTAPDGDDDHLYILERRGTIRIVENGALLETFFLDLREIVDPGVEIVLLGMAFHPAYSNNGLVFLNYAHRQDGVTMPRISQFSTMENVKSLVVADPASEVILLTFDSLIGTHNGGSINFGPADGYLYIPTGDGGGGCCYDPAMQGQDLTVPRGKVLRIDVDHADPPLPYGIPPSNPFINEPGALKEIWAYGLRNPFRSSFDRLTGDFYVADVGHDEREEVNFQPAASMGGENYGWSVFEGTRCSTEVATQDECDQLGPSVTFPLVEMIQPDAQSITGGFVYRGSAIPCLQGTYFFADFVTQRVWSFRNEDVTVTDFVERTAELDPADTLIRGVTAISEDGVGELYVVNIEGSVYRIVAAAPPCRDGDANLDCMLSPADALVAFNGFLGLETLTLCQQYRADVSDPQPTPTVSPADALCIFERFLQVPSCLDAFPQDCTCEKA